MTIAESWKQEGETALLKRLLQRRFGKLPSRYMHQLNSADTDTIQSWSDRIFDATTLEEVFEEQVA